jgi:thymidine phosphorylase
VIECLDVLKGQGPADLIDVSVELTARMLLLGGVAADRADAERRTRAAIASGEGLERFRRTIELQGGDPRVVDDYSRLPAAPVRHVVKATRTGALAQLDAELIGRASVALGAGRDRVADAVDPAVGIVILAKPGAGLAAGDPILELHARDTSRLEGALALADRAIVIADSAPALRSVLVGEVH